LAVDKKENLKSKDAILESLGEYAKPNSLGLKINHITYKNRLNKFIEMAKRAGAEVVYMDKDFDVRSLFQDSTIVVDTINLNYKIHMPNIQNVDLTILRAELGVAESGAVWIDWRDNLYPRSLLTISKYLAIYLNKDTIVSNLAQAYERINLFEVKYGVFLSGPSKTADIEQSLVIGAHGALRVTIVLT
jgi:L-lactate dehydrogenase complex protein LldG